MKKNIHPKYYDEIDVTCACGNKMKVGSTVQELHLDVCSNCHPLYTGAHRFVDTAGRVDKFKARIEKAKQLQDLKNKKTKKIINKSVENNEENEDKKIKKI